LMTSQPYGFGGELVRGLQWLRGDNDRNEFAYVIPGAVTRRDGELPSGNSSRPSTEIFYFGLITISESMLPFPSSSVRGLAGSFSPIPSTRNL